MTAKLFRTRLVFPSALLGSLGLFGVLGTGVASAAPSGSTAGASASSVVLPYGIHGTKSGRYMADVCDHRKRYHCLAEPLPWAR